MFVGTMVDTSENVRNVVDSPANGTKTPPVGVRTQKSKTDPRRRFTIERGNDAWEFPARTSTVRSLLSTTGALGSCP
ncbi:hypothetical protein A4G99_14055 [Haladaptatus sp. R4]|nr:hypothetical protein A4G99_14055 [Haladaptatus sp. R4]